MVTLGDGDRFIHRMSEAALRTAGLDHLVARSTVDYVAKAVAVAGDPARLAEMRQSLRDTVAASPLCDAEGFTRNLEAAFRRMWRDWCAGRTPS